MPIDGNVVEIALLPVGTGRTSYLHSWSECCGPTSAVDAAIRTLHNWKEELTVPDADKAEKIRRITGDQVKPESFCRESEHPADGLRDAI